MRAAVILLLLAGCAAAQPGPEVFAEQVQHASSDELNGILYEGCRGANDLSRAQCVCFARSLQAELPEADFRQAMADLVAIGTATSPDDAKRAKPKTVRLVRKAMRDCADSD